MNNEEDYASNSDESDEDFCPNGDQSDAVSEEESDGEGISEEETPKEEENKAKKARGKRSSTSKKPRSKKSKANGKKEADEVEESLGSGDCSRRQTRRTEDVGSKKSVEKDEIESDEEDKKRKDSLWADFLSDVKTPASSAAKKTNNLVSSSSSAAANGKPVSSASEKPKLVTVTEVVDFAGEAVSIQKTVKASSIKENQSSDTTSTPKTNTHPAKPTPTPPVSSLKRPAANGGVAGGGLGSLLSQIGKKKKISVLEKSKMDWNSFKQSEGIDEELQTYNKGKDGYLERQDFLQRTDVRQFEIEKSLRQSRRN